MLLEHYVILFKEKNEDSFLEYADEVWELLSKAYRHIGGIAGVYSVQDLIDSSDLWKLAVRHGRVTAAALYSLKRGGRKRICSGSDGTEQGKADLYKTYSEDWGRTERSAWSEMSGKALGAALKTGGIPVPVSVAAKLLPDKDIEPIDNFFYVRQIGAERYVKCLVGNAPGVQKGQKPLTPEQIENFKELSKRYSQEFENSK